MFQFFSLQHIPRNRCSSVLINTAVYTMCITASSLLRLYTCSHISTGITEVIVYSVLSAAETWVTYSSLLSLNASHVDSGGNWRYRCYSDSTLLFILQPCLSEPPRRPQTGQTGYLFKLSEEVSLEHGFLSLLLPRESCELSAAVRFDAHPSENLFFNTAKDYIKRPGQDTCISIWT